MLKYFYRSKNCNVISVESVTWFVFFFCFASFIYFCSRVFLEYAYNVYLNIGIGWWVSVSIWVFFFENKFRNVELVFTYWLYFISWQFTRAQYWISTRILLLNIVEDSRDTKLFINYENVWWNFFVVCVYRFIFVWSKLLLISFWSNRWNCFKLFIEVVVVGSVLPLLLVVFYVHLSLSQICISYRTFLLLLHILV